jgi:hypothetical protein
MVGGGFKRGVREGAPSYFGADSSSFIGGFLCVKIGWAEEFIAVCAGNLEGFGSDPKNVVEMKGGNLQIF